MTYSNWELGQRFAIGSTKGKAKNMFIEDNTIYSYGQHWPIAVRMDEKNALVNTQRYSISTTRQTDDVYGALENKNFRIWECNQDEIERFLLYPSEPVVLTKTKYSTEFRTIMSMLRSHCKGRGVKRFPMKKFVRQIEEMIFIARL